VKREDDPSSTQPQTVQAPAGVETRAKSFETDGVFLGCAYEYPDQDPTSGCETPELLGAVEKDVGRAVSSFHGCYAASDFVIGAGLVSSSDCAVDMGYAHTSMVSTTCTDPPAPTNPGSGCAGKTGTGHYEGFVCDAGLYPDGGPFIITEDISCKDALANCALNASANPTLSVQCTWNGDVVFTVEKQAGACSP
jgi:hypothetical protein